MTVVFLNELAKIEYLGNLCFNAFIQDLTQHFTLGRSHGSYSPKGEDVALLLHHLKRTGLIDGFNGLVDRLSKFVSHFHVGTFPAVFFPLESLDRAFRSR